MAWIRTLRDDEATGRLKRIFDAAVARAGQVWEIVRLMSLRPRQIDACMGLYQEVMFGESGLSRAEREMVAVVVSAANRCYY